MQVLISFLTELFGDLLDLLLKLFYVLVFLLGDLLPLPFAVLLSLQPLLKLGLLQFQSVDLFSEL